MPQSYPSPHTPHTPHTLHTPHTPHTSHDCHVSNASVPTAQPSTLPASTLSRQNIWQGFKQLTPISLFVVVFGAAFGLAAIQVGLSNSATLSMSAFVFAGASQFATLELWVRKCPFSPFSSPFSPSTPATFSWAPHSTLGCVHYPHGSVMASCWWHQTPTGQWQCRPFTDTAATSMATNMTEQVWAFYSAAGLPFGYFGCLAPHWASILDKPLKTQPA